MTTFQVRTAKAASEFDEAYDDPREREAKFFSEPLSKVRQRRLVTVTTSATVGEVIAALNEGHSGCALVTRGGKLAGIFTERDVLTKVAARDLPASTPITEVMTADPDTLPATASVAYALRHMSVEGYRHIPLVDAEGKPTGVVAVRDIVAWMCELFPADVLNLPPTPGFPRTTDGG